MYHHASANARLFLAALPDSSTAARIHALATTLKRAHRFSGKLIVPERLHLSLFFLSGLSEQMLRAAYEVLASLSVPPFDICFDRTASFRGRSGSRPFVLIGGDGVGRLKSFRRELGAGLARAGLKRLANTNFEPHVTLLYDARSVEEYPLGAPISWTISEVVLVQSSKGHAHLAKWQLRA